MQTNDVHYLSDKDAAKRYGVARSTIRAWSNDPQNPFPKFIKFGESTSRLSSVDLDAYDEKMRTAAA